MVKVKPRKTKTATKKARVKKKRVKTAEPIKTRRGAIKKKLTRSELIGRLVTAVDEVQRPDGTLVVEDRSLSTADVKRIINGVLDGLTDSMKKSLMPGSCGEFALTKTLSVKIKERPAIKKGTKVRNPGTGEMVPSKGRPKRRGVKVRPLIGLKNAAEGVL